ncbi:hypothetical protein [Adhaeribacter rhizoryzae]|uniref:Uncharacterized protein n=1 Tax=Adhaeribacter rhizoryzae TaxID=2607907 RepID=A0A5M6CYQ4_9BACT|nr:hypothetical protein [Adhaeribacter rhizoryzae]KAA5539132.1 hypothetical protein F0145_25015 [Adhaeribacter rhizoryzae]
MENTIAASKELELLRRELINSGFAVGESKFPHTVYAIKPAGMFKNGLGKMAIEYWAGREQFLMMGHFYKTVAEVISYLNSQNKGATPI